MGGGTDGQTHECIDGCYSLSCKAKAFCYHMLFYLAIVPTYHVQAIVLRLGKTG